MLLGSVNDMIKTNSMGKIIIEANNINTTLNKKLVPNGSIISRLISFFLFMVESPLVFFE